MSSKLLVIACWVLRFASPSRSPWHWLERWLKKIQKILQGRMLHVGTQKVLYTSLWQPLTWEQESGKSRGFQDLPPKDTQLTSGVIKRGWLENPHLYRWCSHDGLQNNSKISMDFPATHYPHVGALGLWMVTRVPTGWSVTRAPALWMLWAFDLFWPEKMGGVFQFGILLWGVPVSGDRTMILGLYPNLWVFTMGPPTPGPDSLATRKPMKPMNTTRACDSARARSRMYMPS